MAARSKPNILLVDDEADDLRRLADALDPAEYNVVQARSGEEALRDVLKVTFAVAVLDVHMPALDGFETAQLIRQRRRSRQTPIIFLTGSRADAEAIFQRYTFGTVDFIMKPVAPEALRSKVSMFAHASENGASPVPSPGVPAEVAVLDRAALLERIGGEAALLDEVFMLLRKDCARIMSVMRRSIDERDAPAFGNSITALLGVFRNLSAQRASEAAARLQAVGLDTDRDTIQLAYTRLEREVRLLKEDLLKILGQEVH